MSNDEYAILTTADGSATIYSLAYDEAMHTRDGAYEEALQKHVFPSGVLEIDAEEIRVLDVGFGLGYNILALLVEMTKKKNEQRLHIVSFEKDRSYQPFIDKVSFDDWRDDYYEHIKKAFKDGKVTFANVTIDMYYNDARGSIKSLDDDMFHCVFHDPFSPGKNPELWTVDFFKEIVRVLKNEGTVTTYSSAPQVRLAMVEAGLTIAQGPSFGMKRESTIAAKGCRSLTAFFTADDINVLRNNIKATPYIDPGMENSREIILQTRIEHMQEKRDKLKNL